MVPIRQMISDERGASAVLFSVLLLPLLAGIGFAIDYSRIGASHSALQTLTDAAALAAISPRYSAAEVQSVAEAFIRTEGAKRTAFKTTIGVQASLSGDGRTVTVKTTVPVRNAFMGLFGRPETEVASLATAIRGTKEPLEMVLVLDVTGSMNASGKLATLKSAAKSLVDLITADPLANVKISLVPFATYVNVGLSNRNQSWISGATDTSTTTNVCTPASCNTVTPITGSFNCQTITGTGYNDGAPYTYSYQQCQHTYGPPQQVCTPASCQTQTHTSTWYGCVGSRPSPLYTTDSQPATPYPAMMNKTCNATLIPLTTAFGTIKSAIDGLTADDETYLPSGLVWGLNALSQQAPLTEGKAYDTAGPNKDPRKVVVFMTDGVNTRSLSGASHNGTNRTEADQTTAQLCSEIKNRKIEVFTVALMVPDLATQSMLQACATDAVHFYDATNTSGLTTAFNQIAASLVQPYLSR